MQRVHRYAPLRVIIQRNAASEQTRLAFYERASEISVASIPRIAHESRVLVLIRYAYGVHVARWDASVHAREKGRALDRVC